ncbi:MAG: cyclase family protein [Proteobacteria bacterium]|nr:cyclase family protein [Pseudomonadota bacterium]
MEKINKHQLKHDFVNSIVIINCMVKSASTIIKHFTTAQNTTINQKQIENFLYAMDAIQVQTAKIENYFNILNGETSSSTSKKKEYYDLTTPVTPKTIVYPGDPAFSIETIVSLENGDPFHLCHMHLSNHTGTHIDFPAHVIKGGKTSKDYSIDDLIGSGLIIEVPDTEKSITKSFIETQHSITQNDFIFFKTSNSKLSKQTAFTEKYVYIEPEAAEELIRKGIKIVGIDYINVDSYDAADLPVHHSFLSNNILIVEGLELNEIPEGRYTIYIMPNNIPDMDGLPSRVIAKS